MTFDGVMVNPLLGVLVVPAVAAVLAAVLPDYRITARLNVVATTLTLSCAVALLFAKPQPGSYRDLQTGSWEASAEVSWASGCRPGS